MLHPHRRRPRCRPSPPNLHCPPSRLRHPFPRCRLPPRCPRCSSPPNRLHSARSADRSRRNSRDRFRRSRSYPRRRIARSDTRTSRTRSSDLRCRHCRSSRSAMRYGWYPRTGRRTAADPRDSCRRPARRSVRLDRGCRTCRNAARCSADRRSWFRTEPSWRRTSLHNSLVSRPGPERIRFRKCRSSCRRSTCRCTFHRKPKAQAGNHRRQTDRVDRSGS
jgi:hypothetical protein